MSLTIVAMSDTHGHHEVVDVPDGDILVFGGDITRAGKLEEIPAFNRYLGTLPHRHKIVVAGNHDFCFESSPDICRTMLTNAIYLQDEAATVEGLRFYGSPWQPWFYDWAFNLQRGEEIRRKWDLIPNGTDVLVLHGPPYGFGDLNAGHEPCGCRDLLDAVRRIRPRLCIFGHIHEAAGRYADEHTVYLNASVCDIRYRPVYPPLVYIYETTSPTAPASGPEKE